MKANREIIDIQKNMQQVQGNINSMYTTIGKLYYNRHSESPEPEYVAIFNEIKASEKSLADMNTRIKFLNGVVTCTKCGADNGVASAFCSVCGEKLPHKVNVNDPTKCRNCGSPLVAGRNFCGVCGTPVAQPQIQPQPEFVKSQPETPVQEAAQPQEEIPVQEAAQPEIPVQETVINENQDNITTYPLTGEERPVVDNNEMPSDEVKIRFCPNCGTRARTADAVFCAECGTRF